MNFCVEFEFLRFAVPSVYECFTFVLLLVFLSCYCVCYLYDVAAIIYVMGALNKYLYLYLKQRGPKHILVPPLSDWLRCPIPLISPLITNHINYYLNMLHIVICIIVLCLCSTILTDVCAAAGTRQFL